MGSYKVGLGGSRRDIVGSRSCGKGACGDSWGRARV